MTWLSRNAEIGRPMKLSFWRKISISSWFITHDSSVIAVLELDAEPALKYLEEESKRSGKKLTITHFAGYAIGKVFYEHPEINCLYRWGKLYPRKTADVCFLIASGTGKMAEGEDLSAFTVREADKKGVLGIAEELESRVKSVKAGGDVSFRGIKQMLDYFPHFIRRPLVNLADFIMHSLNLWSPILGIERDAFGSVMLTSVGSLGVEFAIARIYPQSRNSLIISVGAVKDKPVVKQGQVVPGKVVKVAFTADHRIVDGLHAGYMLRTFEKIFQNPRGEPLLGR